MAKPTFIELDDGKTTQRIPILYEDRSALAVDKPASWMLVPFSWQNTNRNLMAAFTSSIAAGDFWARSRNLKFLRNVHRLDADTTGILLFAKSMGAVDAYTELFESRRMEKTYLAVVRGTPKQTEWTCSLPLAPDPRQIGKMKVVSGRDGVSPSQKSNFKSGSASCQPSQGKDAETHFRVLQTHAAADGMHTLVEARPVTGRTHQIRVHLATAGHPVLGDSLYGGTEAKPATDRRLYRPNQRNVTEPLGLRSVYLAYTDPFQKRRVEINAPMEEFLKQFGFKPI